MQHRKIDLRQKLEGVDLQPILKDFKKAGYPVTDKQLLEIAGDIFPSNHWKDIIWNHIQRCEQTAEAAGNPPSESLQTQKPTAPKKGRKAKD